MRRITNTSQMCQCLYSICTIWPTWLAIRLHLMCKGISLHPPVVRILLHTCVSWCQPSIYSSVFCSSPAPDECKYWTAERQSVQVLDVGAGLLHTEYPTLEGFVEELQKLTSEFFWLHVHWLTFENWCVFYFTFHQVHHEPIRINLLFHHCQLLN